MYGYVITERREVEAREKERAAKEKMERERVERERREREREDRIRQDQERQRREMEEKHRQKSQVDEHFDRSIRLAQQKHGGGEGAGHHHYLMQQSQLPANHLPNANTHNHSHRRNTHHHHQQQQHHQTKAPSYQNQAQPQKAAGGWNQIPMVKPPGDERLLDHRIADQRRHEDNLRRAVEPVKMVQDSIYKAFRTTEQDSKSHYPPPAHSSKPPDKATVSALPKLADPSFNLSSNYYHKDPKMAPHPSERVPYVYHDPREKNSVIIKPDTAPPHSASPKQRPHERSSPYAPSSAYKVHEPAPAPHRSSLPHHHSPHSQSPHSVELSKARQPQMSPHSVTSQAHAERAYYPPVAKPPPSTFASPSFNITAGLVPNPMHVSAMPPKAKVSSPPPQVYGKPGITSGTPVCRVDTRVSQPPLPLTTKPAVGGPPPAHSGPSASRGHPEPRALNPHEQRLPYERVPYDGRSYPPTVPSPHHKHVVASGPPPSPQTQARLTPVSSPHVATAHIPSPGPTQTQPLDLGTRDDTASPNKRRTHTPTPQDTKKPRYESVPSSQQPTLSRVSEPSPLYPTAATTITTVENTVALANLSQRVSSPVQRVASPLSRPPSHPPAAGTPTLQHPDRTQSPSLLKQTPQQQQQQQLQQQIHQQKKDDQQQPSSNDPDKSNSPGPPGGYVHKLKKAWLQRHETVSDIQTLPTSTSINTNQSNNSSNNSSPQLSPQPSTTSIINPSKVNTTTLTDSKSDKNQSRKNIVNNSLPNGHSQGRSIKDEDSDSMSDSDGNSSKSSGKRKSHKRKKQRRKGSDSNSDSDKDSDTSESSGKKSERTSSKDEPKKRGRKPKSKNDIKIEDGPKPKKSKEEPPQNDPLQKPPIAHLKKTGESFLQDGSCYEVAPKLPKCRECRWTAHQRNKRNNIFCRFYAFRRLRYTKNGQLAVAGFSDPVKDASPEDTAMWTPNVDNPPTDLDVETSKFIISHVGDQFCDLVQSEREAMAMQAPEDIVMAWKRVVQGVREMCDVCETTLFNVHWACGKCGFVVCIDCYKGRKNGTVRTVEEGPKDRDEFLWLLCASRVAHEQDKLMLTQIISGNALFNLGKSVHEVRHQWGIPQLCECPEAKKYKEETTDDKKKVNGLNKDLLKTVKKEVKPEIVNGVVKTEKENVNGKDDEMSNSPLNFFADVALSNDKRDESSDSDSDSSNDEKGNFSTLRELLIRPNAKSNGNAKDGDSGGAKPTKDGSKKKAKVDSLDDVISCVIETNEDKDEKKSENDMVLKHFVRKYNYVRRGREALPIRIMTKVESSTLYPNVPHSWLCDGKMLRLLDPVNPNNKALFQDMWKRGQPVIISGVGHKLNQDIWKPSAFSKDFGEIKNDLVNCLTGNIVPNQPMKKFWDGFDVYSKRLKDDKGQPMVLKLKDWPPTDDFAELLPTRYEDLMKRLPMEDYTLRDGVFNLAGRLPDSFVRPDLGPKMYIAYGSSLHPNKASTNLHLDISDATNVMCYVGVPKDSDYVENIKEAYKAIDAAGCDILTRKRVREKDEIPGALWHIYHARDSDKIRDFLNKVSIERGDRLEPHHDPIHDQSWYLDGPLRDRLYKDYGVEGYAIVQCYGDAMFIPAGAPHQVRNLHNCVKVAEDFVSPENIAHCFHLTQEFRSLSDTHTNHEDKLQIKNIIYHQMKDTLTVLMAERKKQMDLKEEGSSEGSSEEKIKIKTESDS